MILEWEKEYFSRIEIILVLMSKYSARFPPTTRFLVRFHAGLPLISFTVFPFFERHSRSSDKISLQLSNFFANRFFSSGTITRRWFRRWNIFPPTRFHDRSFTDPVYLFKHDRTFPFPRFRGEEDALSISFIVTVSILLSFQKLRSLSAHLSLSLEVISSATSQFAIPNFASFTVLLLFSRHVNLGFEWERGHEGLLVEGKKKGSFSWIFLFFFMNMLESRVRGRPVFFT